MTPPLDPAARELLRPYVTSLDDPVFCLKNLPEEVIAVLFAYYSRSREDLRANLLRLLRDGELGIGGAEAVGVGDHLTLARDKAREFHEKWVVGYGHASVAEHAVAHIAVEQVSIVASKVIEDARLASFTEKSTRYVRFPRAYYPAPESPDSMGYRAAIERLFDAYESLIDPLTEDIARIADRSAFKTERGFRTSCLAQACDALRYLLPAATHTNIGLTANARTLEHLISKMLSHPLREVQKCGESIHAQALHIVPTLLKYARAKPYWSETRLALQSLAEELLPTVEAVEEPPSCRLVDAPREPELRLAAAILYEFSDLPYEAVLRRVRESGPETPRRVLAEYLSRRRTYGSAGHSYTDPPLRGLEHVAFSTEIVVDYGAYRDIQRHRMATQTTQDLTCELGFDTPELLSRSEHASAYRDAMLHAADAWSTLNRVWPEGASYVIPLGYRRRVLFTWNLRELHHFISLRSARQGHPSYRSIAVQVYDALAEKYPLLAEFIQVDRQSYEMARPG